MAGRMLGLSLLAAVGFLLLFSTGGDVGAVTYKMGYSTRLSCNGPDGVLSTLDDSCVPGAQGAYTASLTADILSRFSVPLAAPKYSNYAILRTFGTPSGWKLAIDKEIPDGAAVGRLVSQSTLALFGGLCQTTLVSTIPMYDCSTDNSSGNLLAWDAATNGRNLLLGKKDGVPIGCKKFPTHANDQAQGIKPRARYMGMTVVTDNMAPTQLEFLMFSPEQLSSLAAPQSYLKDEQGYVNFVVLNNPAIPAPPGDSLDEFCTPLESNTTLWGKTGGQGGLTKDINVPGDIPTASGNFWTVGDPCNNTTDDDTDGVVNEMCGIQRVKNPAAAKGLWGTGTALDGAYGQSYPDADGDGINNEEDECPFQVDLGADPDADKIDSVCDPLPNTANDDPDADGWRAQQDNCPLVAQVALTDTDGDRIGDLCDLVGAGGIGQGPAVADGKYLNDQPSGGICIGDTDSDGDGWCNATEALNPGGGVLSKGTQAGGLAGEADANTPSYTAAYCSDGLDNDADTYIDALDAGCSTPEYKALDYAVVSAAGAQSPGAAPRTCDNWSYYNSTVLPLNHGGVAPEVDDDGDTLVNAADLNCGAIAGDTDQDGVLNASDNCPSAWNPTQLDTDGDTVGDACDTDDDADNILDTAEWTAGSDAKNVCDPVSFDTKVSATISVADIVAFTFPLKVPNRPCLAPVNYNVCR